MMKFNTSFVNVFLELQVKVQNYQSDEASRESLKCIFVFILKPPQLINDQTLSLSVNQTYFSKQSAVSWTITVI